VITLGKFLAAICAVLFVISTLIVLLLFNIERKAFSSETYKQAFENQRLYERLPAMLASTLTTSIAENPNAVPLLKALTVENWQVSLSTLLPPEELKALTNNALDSTFDYLNGKTDSAIISLVPIKTHLVGESGLQVVRQFLSLQPACTTEQLTQMALGLLGGQIILCNPPEEAMGLMAPFIQAQLQAMTTIIPDQITFIPGTTSNTPNDPRLKLNMVRSAIKLAPFIPVFFLFGIAIFAVRTLREWLIWWGWPFILTGATSVLIGLIGSPLIGWILQLVIRNQGTIFIPPVLAASIGETTSAVARQMLAPVVAEGFILALLGLGMVIASLFISTQIRYTNLEDHYHSDN
jgi:hypothetical protein